MFNSRDINHRNPMGAVKEGTRVHFKISMPRELSCSAALLIIDEDAGQRFVLDMFWCGMNGTDEEWWECHFTPDKRGLYFYYFEAKTNRGHTSLYKGIGGKSNMGAGGNRWQLTVYDNTFTTPNWLTGGIMYQIFPDRFCNSGEIKENVPYGRSFHKDWNESPDWQPDSRGEITNQDYFGGDLKGIMSKLDYLEELGVTCIYLNPIFEAHSNHRYNTADYSTIDPTLGTLEDFNQLCTEAQIHGIKIILDGVFNHTGSDSIYFNREGRYPTAGAYDSKDSPYYPWYYFKAWPEDYESWWGFKTLPNVNETNPQYNEYINGEKGIIRNWLKEGASGWRLDVADELPDEFLDNLYKAAKAQNPNSIVLGEVWEDASNKSAYGVRRRYLLGGQMDTVMNYPFREAVLGFLTGEHSSLCMDKIENVMENYPPESIKILMNHIGTHDTERAITVLAGEPVNGNGRKWQATTALTPEQQEIGTAKMRLASLLQFTLPGVPCIYYGDEAGAQGYRDPFNRGTYPWDNQDKNMVFWYKKLASLRKSFDIFRDGSMRNVYSHKDILSFERYKVRDDKTVESIFVAVNRSDDNAIIPIKLSGATLVMGTNYSEEYKLPPFGFSVLHIITEPEDAD